jgi:exodeoxyribonuclease V gamma subunit
VCAHVDFPSPRRVVGQAVAEASGVDPDADPWEPERAVWPLLEEVDASLDEPWLALLAGHLGEEGDAAARARRFSTVRHLAGLFDRYALQRPAMLRAWAEGADVDALGGPLPRTRPGRRSCGGGCARGSARRGPRSASRRRARG